MTSVRSVLACIWPGDGEGTTLPAQPSLARHLFGFARGLVPEDPAPGQTAAVSVRDQVEALEGEHLHLNAIAVGFDAIASQQAREQAAERLDYAIYRTRIIFEQAKLGIGRVRHWSILADDADGLDDIGSGAEARELWESTFVDNDGLDVFVTRTISANFIGLSPVGGRCRKPRRDDALLGGRIDRGADGVARTFAHEIGHFLGLPHNHGADCPTADADRQRLMAQTRCWANVRESLDLIDDEVDTMHDHCSVREGC
jgi:hypothetical protein